jgi:hypothetical protein
MVPGRPFGSASVAQPSDNIALAGGVIIGQLEVLDSDVGVTAHHCRPGYEPMRGLVSLVDSNERLAEFESFGVPALITHDVTVDRVRRAIAL